MDPNFKRWRLSGSAAHWTCEMMRIRYEFLENLDAVITTPQRGIKKTVSDANLLRNDRNTPAATTAGGSGPAPGVMTHTRSNSGTDPLLAPTELPGTRMFYKGGALERLELSKPIYSKLDIRQLGSNPPGDFSNEKRGVYFTTDYQVAWQYANLAARIVDGEVIPVGIFTVAIPLTMLDNNYHLFGDEWRHFVWANRRTLNCPSDLEGVYEYEWIQGGLTHQANATVQTLTDVSELQPWKLDGGEAASQWYTQKRDVYERLDEYCGLTSWVDTIVPRRTQHHSD